MNPVSIHLDTQHTQLLARVWQESGRSYDDLVAEALERVFGPTAAAAPDVVTAQLQALKTLRAELVSLPVSNAADGFTNRDHDRLLYGETS